METRIEEQTGTGELLRGGEVVRRVRYRVSVSRTALGPGGLPIPMLHKLEGQIDLAPEELAPLVGSPLALRLEDGRQLGVIVKDGEGRIESCRHGHDIRGCSCC